MSYMLQAMELGRPVNRDCKVDEIDSHYSVLGALKGMLVNVDQMDYLAKRLDSFCVGEDSQFQAMAHKLEMTDITDFINLTFCCQQVYNGRQLPAYPYDSTLLVLEVAPKRGPAEGDSPEYLYLPASERQIERTLLRVGITALHDAQVRLDFDELPEKAAEALDLEHLSGDDLPALNKMCRAIASLNEADQEKLNAVVLMTGPGDMMAVQQLAENLDQFDFIPGIRTPEEYGMHMIRESGHFEYDENLEGFYDYRRYGEQHIRQEGGQFNEYGYVAYHGTMTLEALMRIDTVGRSQLEQGPQMGGM